MGIQESFVDKARVARWWTKEDDGRVRCGMCFRKCLIPLGKTGGCGVRTNVDGVLESPYLGLFCSLAIDPIEKKPLYHWRQGTSILSLGSIGCTMDCPFCQNYSIAHPVRIPSLRRLSIADCITVCKERGLSSVAFTYNEPTLQAEYICEAAPFFAEAGIDIVLVTNGMFTKEVAEALVACVAAVNIDVKTFTEKHYKRMGGRLAQVKDNVELFVKAGCHVEVTRLIVPKLADDPDDFMAFVTWLAGINSAIPLHLSRYFPAHIYSEPATERSVLEKFFTLAAQKLEHVHLGNIV